MSNLKFCEKCQHGYLSEDGHDCPAEPRGSDDSKGELTQSFITAMAIEREACAKICENDVGYGIDIDNWRAMTKKEHAVRACKECAKAIRKRATT